MRGRTLVGAGIWTDSYGSIYYNIGDIGGERLHQLTIAEMPNHDHYTVGDLGLLGDPRQHIYTRTGSYVLTGGWDSGDPSLNYIMAFGTIYPNNGISSGTGGNQPHNIMQPYISVYYIMKK